VEVISALKFGGSNESDKIVMLLLAWSNDVERR
jgi:hypothetical protein